MISQGEGCREDVGGGGMLENARKITNFKTLYHLGTYLE